MERADRDGARYRGGRYRDRYLSYTFHDPFVLGPPLVPGALSSPISRGQMSTEPDNDYHCQGCHGADAGGPSISAGQYAAYPSLRRL